MSKKYRINEFAKRIGRASSTVRRWERAGNVRRRKPRQRSADKSTAQS